MTAWVHTARRLVKSKIRVFQPGLKDRLKNNPEADFNTVHVLQRHKKYSKNKVLRSYGTCRKN